MGALTDPVWFRGERVASGDVLYVVPRIPRRWFVRPFCGIVDARDRSIPYLAYAKGTRVLKVPLDGVSFAKGAYDVTLYRLPHIDKARGATVAARAAERPGEGVHHPDFDCGRTLAHADLFVPDAYAVIGESITMEGSRPGRPLVEVRGPTDPPNGVIVVDRGATTPTDGDAWIKRGVPKTLPWQKRMRRD